MVNKLLILSCCLILVGGCKEKNPSNDTVQTVPPPPEAVKKQGTDSNTQSTVSKQTTVLINTDTVSEPSTAPVSENFGQPEFEAFGYKWVARDSSWRSGGPQANDKWSAENVRVIGNQVEMRLSNNGGDPIGSEIISVQSMGYGDYELSFEGDFSSFDSSPVFALFTFNWLEDTPGYQEIDAIEISRWGNSLLKAKATYYPENDFARRVTAPDFPWPEGLQKATARLSWRPEAVVWTYLDGNGNVIYSAERNERIPIPSKQQVHINLWTYESDGWRNAKPQSVRLTSFKHTPMR